MALAFCMLTEMVEECGYHQSLPPVSSRAAPGTATELSSGVQQAEPMMWGSPGQRTLMSQLWNHLQAAPPLKSLCPWGPSTADLWWKGQPWWFLNCLWVILPLPLTIAPASVEMANVIKRCFAHTLSVLYWPHFLILFSMDRLQVLQIFKFCFLFD